MINWDKYFDHIYCIHYKPHIERFEELNNELNRVGILESNNFEYLFTEVDNNTYKVPGYKVTLNHLKCLQDAYSKKYNNILILENDIRFLKELDIVEKYLNNIPKDADLVLFDYIFGYEKNEIDRIHFIRKTFSDLYINFGYTTRIFSAACYMCSRNMQLHLINNYTSWTPTTDVLTCYCPVSVDQPLDKSLNRYVPRYNVGIQKVFNNNLRSLVHGSDNTYERYKYQGLKLEDYNI